MPQHRETETSPHPTGAGDCGTRQKMRLWHAADDGLQGAWSRGPEVSTGLGGVRESRAGAYGAKESAFCMACRTTAGSASWRPRTARLLMREWAAVLAA